MIKRMWHGWTTPENADRYLQILTSEVIPGIEAKAIPGYLGIEVLRRALKDEVEFVTIMSFRSLEDIIAFQGPDYQKCYVPEAAQRELKRWEETAQHYDLQETRGHA